MTKDDLIAAQLREFPDSRIVPFIEAERWPRETTKEEPGSVEESAAYVQRMYATHALRVQQYEWLQACLVHNPRVFYECGWNEDEETYRWRGCRYGVNPEDYISGYPR